MPLYKIKQVLLPFSPNLRDWAPNYAAPANNLFLGDDPRFHNLLNLADCLDTAADLAATQKLGFVLHENLVLYEPFGGPCRFPEYCHWFRQLSKEYHAAPNPDYGSLEIPGDENQPRHLTQLFDLAGFIPPNARLSFGAL